MKLDYSIDITQQGERKKLLGLLIYMFILTLILLLAGCGLTQYRTKLILPDGKEVNLESNIPSAVEGINESGTYKIDQRGLSIIEKLIPKNIRIEK
jgi:hypothetical protein